jgi:Cof subfamily protein (haloacid dehalogenase superfamily)
VDYSEQRLLAEAGDLTAVRLVATDLDGTLLSPEGTVSERTAAAVRSARRAGIPVLPVTGRPPQSMWELAGGAGLGPLGACSNGAVLVDVAARAVVSADHLPGEVAARLVNDARAVEPGLRFAVDNLDSFTHETRFFDTAVNWGEEVVRSCEDLGPVLAAGCLKLIARRPGLSSVELIRRLAPAMGPEVHLTTSGLDWVDIGLLGVTKATALARLCRQLGVAAGEVVAVGDNLNDLAMLEWAGQGLAVANAAPEVLEAADGVLPSNHDDGVAQLLERIVAARTT